MPIRYGFLSTYPPTPCGLATFAQSLATSMVPLGGVVEVVRLLDEPEPVTAGPVVQHWVTSDPGGASAAAARLNGHDVAVVQHEYGIYGGDDGDAVLALLNRLTVPVIVVLHTVMSEPTPYQHQILQNVVRAADAVVLMTRTARDRLLAGYEVDPRRVHLIPHGAAAGPGVAQVAAEPRPPMILTWGLLGQGKGIEWGIEAMPALSDLDPAPVYVVAGRTHPRVLEREGETYRDSLKARAHSLGVGKQIIFRDCYLSAAELHQLVREADVVLLPYDSKDQVTSGVLIEAVAAGKPVVSTRFPHAVELLADGVGLLVEQRDPRAISAALRRVMTEPGLASHMATSACDLAPELGWSAVATRYLELGRALQPMTNMQKAGVRVTKRSKRLTAVGADAPALSDSSRHADAQVRA